jgi:cytochrome c oxidase assembly protein subunit 15
MSKVPARFKVATWLALAGVILQGLMGGLRVTQISTTLAMIHGCFAQLFFMYLASITAWSSRTWILLGSSELDPVEKPSKQILRFTLIMPFMFYAQIIAGAWLRHFQAPDKLYLHEILGVTVVVLTTIAGSKIRRSEFGKQMSIRRLRMALVGLTHLQWLLGLLSWWLMRPFDGIPKPVSSLQAILRTSHQANGALLLACAGVMALWVVRAYGVGQPQVSDLSNSAKLEAVCLS